jgi:hypothetical protein
MSERAIRPRRGQRLAAGMAATALMSLGLLVAPATAAEAAVTSGPIISRHSGQCVDVSQGSTSDGAPVVQWPCHRGTNQVWNYWPGGAPDVWKVVNLRSNKCLSVAGGSTANGARIIQGPCSTGQDRVWVWRNLGNGYYEVKNRLSGKCLDLPAGSGSAGVQLIQWTCDGGTNQQWSSG